jgi:hypothetical protein
MTTQRLLTVAEYIGFVDDYSSGIKALLTAVGDEDTPTSMVAYAAAVRDTVVAFAEPDEADITQDLIDGVINTIAAIGREAAIAQYFAPFNSAIRQHIGQDLSTWLEADGTRVPHWWKRAGDTGITPINCFPPETVLLTVAVTGSGTKTTVAGAAVDQTKYGGAQVALKVINQSIGAASIVATVTGVDAAGAARSWTATLTNGSAQGTVVNCAGTGNNNGVSVSAISFTGGTNGDDFEVVTVEDRTIT